jgi:hypothetical protein
MDCLILTLDLAEINYYIENYVVYINLDSLREESLELENSIQQLIDSNNLYSFVQIVETEFGSDLLCVYEPIKYDSQNKPIKGYLESQEKRNSTFYYDYYDYDDYFYDDYELFEYYANYPEIKIYNQYLDKPNTEKIKKKDVK